MNIISDARQDTLDLMDLLEGEVVKKNEEKLNERLRCIRADLVTKVGRAVNSYPLNGSRHTEEEVALAVRFFTKDHRRIMSAMRPLRVSIKNGLRLHIEVLEKMGRVLQSQGSTRRRSAIQLRSDRFRSLLLSFDSEIDQHAATLLQTGLQTMALHKTPETRELIWTQHQARFGEHIKPSKLLKPKTAVTYKDSVACTDKPSFLSGVPPEIMEMIFSACDLETCVRLREVSSVWYLLFQKSDVTLRQKMLARDPWIRPGDDLSSWRDCAMVFVTRLRTWQSATHVDNIRVADKVETRKIVVGFEIGRDERLPDNFSFMTDAHQCVSSCQHLHLRDSTEEHLFSRDFRTLEVTLNEYRHELVSSDDYGTVIKCAGDFHVTLPPSIKPEDITDDIDSTVNTQSYVMVILKNDRAYVLRRDQPHCRHGFEIDYIHGMQPFEIGGNIVLSRWSSDKRIQYSFIDFETKIVRMYNPAATSDLVASYNGMMWWKRDGLMVPTFVDLRSPDKVYYSATKAVTGITQFRASQCSQSRAAQFCIVDGTSDQVGIVDMARGIITTVKPPSGWPDNEHATFVGWLDGRFQARVMSDAVVEELTAEVFERFGIVEEDM